MYSPASLRFLAPAGSSLNPALRITLSRHRKMMMLKGYHDRALLSSAPSVKEPLINSAAHLAAPFPPDKLANFLTYLRGLPARSRCICNAVSSQTVHWTVFRALDPSKPAKSANLSDKKFTRQLTTSFNQRFLKSRLAQADLKLTSPEKDGKMTIIYVQSGKVCFPRGE